MKKFLIAIALIGAAISPAAAQVEGQVHAHTAAQVDVKVKHSLASTAKVSGDSAFAIARAHADSGEVSSATLETKDGRLVYVVNVLNKSKRASTVVVDAMSGRTLEAEEHGGLASTVMHAKENKKLKDAKRDSVAKNP
jgi:uncharacterized membrane protein YkoI